MTNKKSRRNAKNSFQSGDLFLVPSGRKTHAYLGQVAADVRPDIGAVYCLFFATTVRNADDASLNCAGARSKLIAAHLVTAEMLERGDWKIVARTEVRPNPAAAVEKMRDNGFVGEWITGGGLVGEYLDTFFGVQPEEEWPDIKIVKQFFLSDFPRRPSS